MSNLGNLCFLSLTFNWQLHGRLLFPTMEKISEMAFPQFKSISQSLAFLEAKRRPDGDSISTTHKFFEWAKVAIKGIKIRFVS